MKFKHFILLILAFLAISCKSKKDNSLQTKYNFKKENSLLPKPLGVVSDYENILTNSEIEKLSNFIVNYEKKTTNEIAIVSIDSIKPYNDITKYSTDLGNLWGVGKKETDNGLIILISSKLRTIRISSGNGTEKYLPDEFCKKVIDSIILPEFKNQKYYSGLYKGLENLTKKWDEKR